MDQDNDDHSDRFVLRILQMKQSLLTGHGYQEHLRLIEKECNEQCLTQALNELVKHACETKNITLLSNMFTRGANCYRLALDLVYLGGIDEFIQLVHSNLPEEYTVNYVPCIYWAAYGGHFDLAKHLILTEPSLINIFADDKTTKEEKRTKLAVGNILVDAIFCHYEEDTPQAYNACTFLAWLLDQKLVPLMLVPKDMMAMLLNTGWGKNFALPNQDSCDPSKGMPLTTPSMENVNESQTDNEEKKGGDGNEDDKKNDNKDNNNEDKNNDNEDDDNDDDDNDDDEDDEDDTDDEDDGVDHDEDDEDDDSYNNDNAINNGSEKSNMKLLKRKLDKMIALKKLHKSITEQLPHVLYILPRDLVQYTLSSLVSF